MFRRSGSGQHDHGRNLDFWAICASRALPNQMLGKAQTIKILGNPHRTRIPSAIQVPQFAGFR